MYCYHLLLWYFYLVLYIFWILDNCQSKSTLSLDPSKGQVRIVLLVKLTKAVKKAVPVIKEMMKMVDQSLSQVHQVLYTVIGFQGMSIFIRTLVKKYISTVYWSVQTYYKYQKYNIATTFFAEKKHQWTNGPNECSYIKLSYYWLGGYHVTDRLVKENEFINNHSIYQYFNLSQVSVTQLIIWYRKMILMHWNLSKISLTRNVQNWDKIFVCFIQSVRFLLCPS